MIASGERRRKASAAAAFGHEPTPIRRRSASRSENVSRRLDNLDSGRCHGCEAAGAIYDLASVLLGGPTGRWLRGNRFAQAHERVRGAFGEL